METLRLTSAWDKTFPQSDKVTHSKVTFTNRYGITLAADLYIPKTQQANCPPSPSSGPFGAVKEQASGLYAQTMAERGFLTIAFDPSYTGESGGTPRYVASPDINTEDFQRGGGLSVPAGRRGSRNVSASSASAAGADCALNAAANGSPESRPPSHPPCTT